ncbi:MAG: DNA-processing protein DprA, partial [Candidatus Shapirobacteria bacterium]|nr:DNA-processing protein DprA [Candidatus Shapirobacteria bacterium]
KRCDKLIVIEGGENSGTFLVAQLVLEMGKEVWAVPGRITDEGSAAPNWLIKNGAEILTDLTEALQ